MGTVFSVHAAEFDALAEQLSSCVHASGSGSRPVFTPRLSDASIASTGARASAGGARTTRCPSRCGGPAAHARLAGCVQARQQQRARRELQ